MNKEEIKKRIDEIEIAMAGADFWSDKTKAQAMIREIGDLKNKLEGVGEFDRGDCIMTIFSGAGGDDSEDFTRMLFNMYLKLFARKNFKYSLLSQNENDHGGFRNISIEVMGKNTYGTLKNESGVHRLVRLSPFNAKKLRQTSFSLVEVIPKIPEGALPEIRLDDIKVEMSKSGGPGGQNVNKRETAVRATHIPTGINVYVTTERSQEQNRARAMEMLAGKLYKRAEEEKKTLAESLQISKTTDIEWGNQIRSYVLHPYKMVKDHRTDIETSDVDGVLLEGHLDDFLEAEKGI
ncbi:MAG: PCRF domain-containing protein [Candidatus Pacebacteria bacterium]|nr:PCRF domain-containing protein [Candidatus Paceibacterota bacterium]MBP9772973.1 PCRF domain-containing protein [Candidatus Paceibacterota bacterium]